MVIGLGLLLGWAAILGGALASGTFARFLYAKSSFWVMLALVLTWAWEAIRFFHARGFEPRVFLRKHRLVLGLALVLTAVAVVSSPPRFRVLSDETNLLGVSQSFFQDRTAYNRTQQKFFYGSLNPISEEIEKRPFLFPFLTFVVHLVRGYDAQNPFILNALVLVALLSTAGILVSSLWGRRAGVAGQLLLMACPQLVYSATSGGFEVLALLFLLWAFWLAWLKIEEPSSEVLPFLWVSLLMLSNVRYESALFLVLILGSLFWAGDLKASAFRARPAFYGASLFFLIPLIVQRILIPHPYENAPGEPPFAWSHFIKDLQIFLKTQLNFDWIQPHALLLNWVALGVLLCFLAFALKRGFPSLKTPVARFWTLVWGALALSFIIFLSYYFGNYEHPASSRFFLPISVALVLAPFWLLRAFPGVVRPSHVLCYAVAAFLAYHPVAVGQRFTQVQILIRESEMLFDYLKKNAQDRNVLVITGRPGQVTALGYGAVDFSYANQHSAELLGNYRGHLFREILVAQRIEYRTQKPVADDQLDLAYPLETVSELQTDAVTYSRISRVKRF